MARAPSQYDDSSESGGLVARERQGDNAPPLSITEISGLLKRTVEDQFGHVRLRGEMSGVKRAASGHLYCALKDDKAVLDGVMWRGNAGRLSFAPEDGLEVIATGKLTTYAGRSKYQIVIDSLELAGEGALLALLEKTRARLEAEGLFSRDRKRALPYLPRTIGVVTSPTGSVIRDILHRLADRFPSHVIVWPVLVQGKGAAEQVSGAIRGFSALPADGPVARPDIVIVARGGGSIEDLWSFNEEAVVRAIAECTIPVISAVGHETDTTLADYAADRRAPTPTAAAEMAVPVRVDLEATLADFAARQRRAVYRPVELGRERLEARVRRMPKPEQIVQTQTQRLDDLAERLRRGLMDRAGQGRERLAGVASRLSPNALKRAHGDAQRRLDNMRLVPALIERPLAAKRDALAALARIAEQLHPEKPLERGYAIVRDANGAALTSKAQAEREAALKLQFKDDVLEVTTGASGAAPPSVTSPAKPKRTPKPKATREPASGTPPRQNDLFD
ncbi:exodeoxyribonuclease VII large subunit [Erythrobacter insulae]|uniref:Exodeoxyribonuclease 7 large subunit n=1 Tax=Erythrobacter insulae TaxID=2584124 RepID=A0A547PBA4_9SPHN|nr:exodeoxyribonuclease VII large subunit [Erythrobacter insulae]TRD11304.1 exodeoxyribonuclease VII large subunit [Erythrobacter insulae]